MPIPDVTTVSTTLVTDVGTQLINASVAVLPVVALVAVPLAVIGAVGAKLGLRKRLGVKV